MCKRLAKCLPKAAPLTSLHKDSVRIPAPKCRLNTVLSVKCQAAERISRAQAQEVPKSSRRHVLIQAAALSVILPARVAAQEDAMQLPKSEALQPLCQHDGASTNEMNLHCKAASLFIP